MEFLRRIFREKPKLTCEELERRLDVQRKLTADYLQDNIDLSQYRKELEKVETRLDLRALAADLDSRK